MSPPPARRTRNSSNVDVNASSLHANDRSRFSSHHGTALHLLYVSCAGLAVISFRPAVARRSPLRRCLVGPPISSSTKYHTAE